MMENQDTSIRGFQDGYFNVTFDGIRWGDSNDFTHHSTSYFMPQNTGSVVVDRGPGTAAESLDRDLGRSGPHVPRRRMYSRRALPHGSG